MTPAAAILILIGYTVVDGDTLDAGGVGIRLWGIDAPERDEPGADAATDALRAITGGVELRCDLVGADRYRRIVARCDLPDGRDVACEMVAQGHARDWPRYSGGQYAACSNRK